MGLFWQRKASTLYILVDKSIHYKIPITNYLIINNIKGGISCYTNPNKGLLPSNHACICHSFSPSWCLFFLFSLIHFRIKNCLRFSVNIALAERC